MAIEVQLEGEWCYPRVVCDWCAGAIEETAHGNVYWYHDQPEMLYFNHKRCAWDHDRHLEAKREGAVLLSEELERFLAYLLGNTKFTKSRRSA